MRYILASEKSFSYSEVYLDPRLKTHPLLRDKYAQSSLSHLSTSAAISKLVLNNDKDLASVLDVLKEPLVLSKAYLEACVNQCAAEYSCSSTLDQKMRVVALASHLAGPYINFFKKWVFGRIDVDSSEVVLDAKAQLLGVLDQLVRIRAGLLGPKDVKFERKQAQLNKRRNLSAGAGVDSSKNTQPTPVDVEGLLYERARYLWIQVQVGMLKDAFSSDFYKPIEAKLVDAQKRGEEELDQHETLIPADHSEEFIKNLKSDLQAGLDGSDDGMQMLALLYKSALKAGDIGFNNSFQKIKYEPSLSLLIESVARLTKDNPADIKWLFELVGQSPLDGVGNAHSALLIRLAHATELFTTHKTDPSLDTVRLAVRTYWTQYFNSPFLRLPDANLNAAMLKCTAVHEALAPILRNAFKSGLLRIRKNKSLHRGIIAEDIDFARHIGARVNAFPVWQRAAALMEWEEFKEFSNIGPQFDAAAFIRSAAVPCYERLLAGLKSAILNKDLRVEKSYHIIADMKLYLDLQPHMTTAKQKSEFLFKLVCEAPETAGYFKQMLVRMVDGQSCLDQDFLDLILANFSTSTPKLALLIAEFLSVFGNVADYQEKILPIIRGAFLIEGQDLNEAMCDLLVKLKLRDDQLAEFRTLLLDKILDSGLTYTLRRNLLKIGVPPLSKAQVTALVNALFRNLQSDEGDCINYGLFFEHLELLEANGLPDCFKSELIKNLDVFNTIEPPLDETQFEKLYQLLCSLTDRMTAEQKAQIPVMFALKSYWIETPTHILKRLTRENHNNEEFVDALLDSLAHQLSNHPDCPDRTGLLNALSACDFDEDQKSMFNDLFDDLIYYSDAKSIQSALRLAIRLKLHVRTVCKALTYSLAESDHEAPELVFNTFLRNKDIVKKHAKNTFDKAVKDVLMKNTLSCGIVNQFLRLIKEISPDPQPLSSIFNMACSVAFGGDLPSYLALVDPAHADQETNLFKYSKEAVSSIDEAFVRAQFAQKRSKMSAHNIDMPQHEKQSEFIRFLLVMKRVMPSHLNSVYYEELEKVDGVNDYFVSELASQLCKMDQVTPDFASYLKTKLFAFIEKDSNSPKFSALSALSELSLTSAEKEHVFKACESMFTVDQYYDVLPAMGRVAHRPEQLGCFVDLAYQRGSVIPLRAETLQSLSKCGYKVDHEGRPFKQSQTVPVQTGPTSSLAFGAGSGSSGGGGAAAGAGVPASELGLK